MFSELFFNLLLFIVAGALPSIAQGDRTELEIYIRDVITQLWQDWPNMMCLPVSAGQSKTYISSLVFFCGNSNVADPKKLWNSLIRVPQLIVQFLKGLLHSCLFLHRTHFILHAGRSTVATIRRFTFQCSNVMGSTCWILSVLLLVSAFV